MSKKQINNGGPAFPPSCTMEGHSPNVPEGMTLRQWYAGQVISGSKSGSVIATPAQWAETAFEIADAMIAHEQKERGESE